MRFLWLTWKDHKHPAAGGAEVVLWELSRKLIADGHEVSLLTCGYDGAAHDEWLDGVHIMRVGSNRYTHPVQALMYYVRELRRQYDVVIETVNTAPYFSVFFAKQSQRFLFYHQLAREIWFYETKPPLSHFGRYVMEPVATHLLGRSKIPTITVSESTRQDLLRHGFEPEKTQIISEGIEIEPVPDLRAVKKFKTPTLLSLGALRAMKRTLHQLEAFELAKKKLPALQFKLAGSASDGYGKEVLSRISRSPFANDIEYLGRVSQTEKINLMRRSHLITSTSIKEGWRLTVTEAASQGTPAVVYDIDGLRDSVRSGETGIITEQSPQALSSGIVKILANKSLYSRLQKSAWAWSKQITFDNSYKDFKKIVGLV